MPRSAYAPQVPMLAAKAPALKAKLNGVPAVNRGLGGILRRQPGSRGYVNAGTTAATSAMATAKSLRSGTIADFFNQTDSTYGIFGSHNAGEFIQIDFGIARKVTAVTYRNAAGGSWAPYTMQIQSSNDGTNWTTEVDYSDNNTTSVQSISITTNKSARYWRMFQNSGTRSNSAGYEWHFNRFSMTASDLIEI